MAATAHYTPETTHQPMMRRTRRPTPDEQPAARRRLWGRPRRVVKAQYLDGLARFRQQHPELTFTQAVEQLALLHRISPRTAWRFMRGVLRPRKPVSKGRRVKTDKERQQIHALRARGLSNRRIARILGRDPRTVRRWLGRPPDFRVIRSSRPRDGRGRFAPLDFGERLAPSVETRLLAPLAPTEVEEEAKALRVRLETALAGQEHLSDQERLDVQQRIRRLKALKIQRLASGPVPVPTSSQTVELPPARPLLPRGDPPASAPSSHDPASAFWRELDDVWRGRVALGVSPSDMSVWLSAFLKGDVRSLPQPRPNVLRRRRDGTGGAPSDIDFG